MEITEIFEKYKAELDEDTKLDELCLKEAQLMLAGRKHKWVGRLMQQKRELYKLKRLKKQTSKQLIDQIQSETNVDMSNIALNRKIENLPQIEKIDEAIEESEILIQYLEKVEVIFRSMTYDIKNIIDIQKLESL